MHNPLPLHPIQTAPHVHVKTVCGGHRQLRLKLEKTINVFFEEGWEEKKENVIYQSILKTERERKFLNFAVDTFSLMKSH